MVVIQDFNYIEVSSRSHTKRNVFGGISKEKCLGIVN